MVRRSFQGYLELASGAGELTRSKVVEVVHELCMVAVSNTSRKNAAKHAERFVHYAFRATGKDRSQDASALRREVEAMPGRVGLPQVLVQVQALGASATDLAAQVGQIARGLRAAGASAPVAGVEESFVVTPQPADEAFAVSVGRERAAPATGVSLSRKVSTKKTAPRSASASSSPSTSSRRKRMSSSKKAASQTSALQGVAARTLAARKATKTTSQSAGSSSRASGSRL
ncbi:MAG: hypothetical protein ACRCXL_02235 [Dermatophilaceae bacterium]